MEQFTENTTTTPITPPFQTTPMHKIRLTLSMEAEISDEEYIDLGNEFFGIVSKENPDLCRIDELQPDGFWKIIHLYTKIGIPSNENTTI